MKKQTQRDSQNEETEKQMKEQDKNSEKELNEMEISNLPNEEFKTLDIKMLNKLRITIDELSKNFNKETENILERTNKD